MKDYLKKYITLLFAFSLITFGVLVYYKVFLCNKAKGPLKIFLLFNSLFVSDFSIIAPSYAKGDQLSPVFAFLLRVLKKFINVILAKTLLTRELPKQRDIIHLFLIILHFFAFACFHKSLELTKNET